MSNTRKECNYYSRRKTNDNSINTDETKFNFVVFNNNY